MNMTESDGTQLCLIVLQWWLQHLVAAVENWTTWWSQEIEPNISSGRNRRRATTSQIFASLHHLFWKPVLPHKNVMISIGTDLSRSVVKPQSDDAHKAREGNEANEPSHIENDVMTISDRKGNLDTQIDCQKWIEMNEKIKNMSVKETKRDSKSGRGALRGIFRSAIGTRIYVWRHLIGWTFSSTKLI